MILINLRYFYGRCRIFVKYRILHFRNNMRLQYHLLMIQVNKYHLLARAHLAAKLLRWAGRVDSNFMTRYNRAIIEQHEERIRMEWFA